MSEDNQGKIIMAIFIVVFLIAFSSTMRTFNTVFDFTINPAYIMIMVGIIILGWIISTYNKFVNLQQRIKQASGSIDVYLKQRFDLIPNLVETVKGYANHEKELLTTITKLRKDYVNRNQNDIKEAQELNERYSNILALAEGYPELKASESFVNLQKVLSKIESQLQAARRIYNMEVTEYNTKRLKIPSNIIAYLFRFKEAALFEATEDERKNISSKF